MKYICYLLFVFVFVSCARYSYDSYNPEHKYYIVNINYKNKYFSPSKTYGEIHITKIKQEKELYIIYASRNDKKCVIISKYNEERSTSNIKLKKGMNYLFLIKSIKDLMKIDMYAEIKAFPYDHTYDIWLSNELTIADIFVSDQLNGLYLLDNQEVK